MIINPDRNGCTVWHGDKVRHIKGSPQECIDRIIEFANKIGIGVYERKFIDNEFKPNFLRLDVGGDGRYWTMILNKMRVRYDEIRGDRFL
jgi:hypothetical protein